MAVFKAHGGGRSPGGRAPPSAARAAGKKWGLQGRYAHFHEKKMGTHLLQTAARPACCLIIAAIVYDVPALLLFRAQTSFTLNPLITSAKAVRALHHLWRCLYLPTLTRTLTRASACARTTRTHTLSHERQVWRWWRWWAGQQWRRRRRRRQRGRLPPPGGGACPKRPWPWRLWRSMGGVEGGEQMTLQSGACQPGRGG